MSDSRPFGYCIFTFEGGDWQNDNFPGLERGFQLAKELGFAYVEIPSYVKPGLLSADDARTDLQFLNRIGTIADLSREYGIPLSSIFTAADLWAEDERPVEYHHLEVLARVASTLGVQHLPVTIGMQRGSDSGRWSAELGRLATEAGKRTAEVGVKLDVHPHIETPIETGSEIDAFFAAADPEYVGFCLDTGHVLAGGADPVQIARDYAGVITYVHAKDIDRDAAAQALHSTEYRARYRAFRNPGDGDVDFPGVFAALAAAGFEGPILAENDMSPDPENAMRESADFLRAALQAASTPTGA